MDDLVPTVEIGDISQAQLSMFLESPTVAWDTETTGLDWQSDRLATCQLYSPRAGVVVCQLLPGRVAPRLAGLLSNEAVTKIFHHAPFDLRFMSKAWAVEAANVRCTKVASKLLNPHGDRAAHSLQGLLALELGVQVTKGSVRTSDWAASRLTADQIAYAAADVLHLIDLHAAMLRKLEARSLQKLYFKCCEFLPYRVELELAELPDVFAY